MAYFGWDYKRDHSLTSATELTDYQVKILVSYSSGTSSGDTVYLDGKCKADFGDIRFADSDNNELSYWIESVSGTLATIWVKIPTINTTTIWIYYGNSSASTTSDDSTTFFLVDTFDDASLDTSKWTQQSLGVCSETAGYLEIQGSTYTWDTAGLTTAAGVKNTGISISGPFSIWCSLTYDVTQVNALGIIHLLIHSSTDKAYIGLNDSVGDYRYGYVTAAINAGYGTVDTSKKTTGTVTLKITRDSSNVCKLYWNGQLQYSNTLTGTINQLTLSNCRYNAYTGNLSRFNSVYAGGYAETEPSHGAWSEEILNESCADFESLYNVGEFVSFVSLYFVGESVDFSSKYNIEWLVDFVLKYHIEIETAFESIYKIKTDHNFTTCITSNDKKSAEFRTRVESVRSSAIRFEMT